MFNGHTVYLRIGVFNYVSIRRWRITGKSLHPAVDDNTFWCGCADNGDDDTQNTPFRRERFRIADPSQTLVNIRAAPCFRTAEFFRCCFRTCAAATDDVHRDTVVCQEVECLCEKRFGSDIARIRHHTLEVDAGHFHDLPCEVLCFLGGLHTTASTSGIEFHNNRHDTTVSKCFLRDTGCGLL